MAPPREHPPGFGEDENSFPSRAAGGGFLGDFDLIMGGESDSDDDGIDDFGGEHMDGPAGYTILTMDDSGTLHETDSDAPSGVQSSFVTNVNPLYPGDAAQYLAMHGAAGYTEISAVPPDQAPPTMEMTPAGNHGVHGSIGIGGGYTSDSYTSGALSFMNPGFDNDSGDGLHSDSASSSGLGSSHGNATYTNAVGTSSNLTAGAVSDDQASSSLNAGTHYTWTHNSIVSARGDNLPQIVEEEEAGFAVVSEDEDGQVRNDLIGNDYVIISSVTQDSVCSDVASPRQITAQLTASHVEEMEDTCLGEAALAGSSIGLTSDLCGGHLVSSHPTVPLEDLLHAAVRQSLSVQTAENSQQSCSHTLGPASWSDITSCNPTSCNPTSCNSTSCNPTSCNPTSCNPTSCNPTATSSLVDLSLYSSPVCTHCGIMDEQIGKESISKADVSLVPEPNTISSVPEPNGVTPHADSEGVGNGPNVKGGGHSSNQSGEWALPDEQAAKVKEAMRLVKLPDHVIPEWARSVPEEAWVGAIRDKMSAMSKVSVEPPKRTHTAGNTQKGATRTAAEGNLLQQVSCNQLPGVESNRTRDDKVVEEDSSDEDCEEQESDGDDNFADFDRAGYVCIADTDDDAATCD